MSAEDYFDNPFDIDGDYPQDNADTYSRAGGPVYCNRCNAGPFQWKYNGTRWRLHNRDGKPHTCSNPVHPSSPALPSRIMEETTSTFTPTIKESIMDKNAAAFIRNDVRTLLVAFIDSEKGSTEEYTPEVIRQRALPYKKYTYLTIDQNIQAGDWALVSVRGIIKAVYVVSVSDELNIEPNAPVTYNFIIGRVDLTQYQSLVEQNAKISDMLRTSYQASLREGFRQTLLNGLPEDQRNNISLLLSKD